MQALIIPVHKEYYSYIAIDDLPAQEWSGAILKQLPITGYFRFVSLHCRVRVSSVVWLKPS